MNSTSVECVVQVIHNTVVKYTKTTRWHCKKEVEQCACAWLYKRLNTDLEFISAPLYVGVLYRHDYDFVIIQKGETNDRNSNLLCDVLSLKIIIRKCLNNFYVIGAGNSYIFPVRKSEVVSF